MQGEPLSPYAQKRQEDQNRHFRRKATELERELRDETAKYVLFRQKVSDLLGHGPNGSEDFLLEELGKLVDEVIACRKRSAE